jgi:uncharacterized protein (TIGR02246 family)
MSEIDSVVARFCDAWNRHDVAALAALWAEDGELVHPWGIRAVGHDAIREVLRAEHAFTMAESSIELSIHTTRAGEHSAVAEMRGVLTGVLAPNGRTYSLPHSISAMFVPHGDDWRIRALAPVANRR